MMKKVLLTGGACLLAVTAFCQLQSGTFADRVQIQDMEIQTQNLLKGLWMLTTTGANQHQGTAVVGLQRKNYLSSAATGNDYNDKVGIWLKGYYQNMGGAMPIYIGGDGYNTDDCKMMVDRNGNVGIGTVDAGTSYNLNQGSYPSFSGNDKVLSIHSSTQPVLELARNVSGAAAGTRIGGLYFTNTTGQSDAHRQVAGMWAESRSAPPYPGLTGARIVFMTKGISGGVQQKMVFDEWGGLGIGTENTHGYKLAVAGDMIAAKVKVKTVANWPDYVFADTYQLPSLGELAKYIREHQHLPEMPSAEEVKQEGIELAEMDKKLLQKIEELTLYVIKLGEENQQLKKDIEAIKASK